MEPVPSLSKVFSLLLQDEKQRKVGAGKKALIDSSALVVFGSKPGNNNKSFVKSKNGRPQCTHCGAMGHVVDKCYKLHGYPPGYRFKNKGGQPFASNVVADEDHVSEPITLTKSQYQKLVGLLNSQCHFGTQAPEAFPENVHQAATIITQPPMDVQAQTLAGISFSPSLKHSVFSSSINTSQISPYDWILDSGATDHMVDSIQFFTSVTSSAQIFVRLPNGDMVKVTHIGTV